MQDILQPIKSRNKKLRNPVGNPKHQLPIEELTAIPIWSMSNSNVHTFDVLFLDFRLFKIVILELCDWFYVPYDYVFVSVGEFVHSYIQHSEIESIIGDLFIRLLVLGLLFPSECLKWTHHISSFILYRIV